MLASPSIKDEKVRRRVERQAALIIAGVQMLKLHQGLPLAYVPFDDNDLQLLTDAKHALEATGVPPADVWTVMHKPNEHECIRAFLA